VAEPEWQEAPIAPMLSSQTVHLWKASLDCSTAALEYYTATLSSDERARVERFRFPRDRQRFAIGRGILRVLLHRYLGEPPAALRFCYGATGKPTLEDVTGSGLTFNLSHSQALMLCVVTQHHRVGVDLEYVRSLSDREHLTQRFFTDREHRAIQALPEARRSWAFFQHWTGKEALLKATGDGLANLSAVELAMVDDGVELCQWHGRVLTLPWLLHSFAPAPNCVAAVAIEVAAADMSTPIIPQCLFWQWQDE